MQVDFAVSILHWLALTIRELSPAPLLLAALWLGLLFWKATARLLVVQIMGSLATLDLFISAFTLAGAAANPVKLRVITTPLDGLLLASSLLLITLLPVQVHQSMRTEWLSTAETGPIVAIERQAIVGDETYLDTSTRV